MTLSRSLPPLKRSGFNDLNEIATAHPDGTYPILTCPASICALDDWRQTPRVSMTRLPLLVPLVFYQGARRWRYAREFAELVTDAQPQWRWVPRFEHLLIDQTETGPDAVSGAAAARLLQIAMMAAFREASEELLERATRLIGEVNRRDGFAAAVKHVEYVLATQPEERRKLFAEALRRNVPGPGGEVMNYVEEIIEQGRREGELKGRREGELRGRREGQLQAIEGFVARDVPWSTIEAATGIDEATFQRLRQSLGDADDIGSTPTA